MKLNLVKVENYRLLKDFELSLEDDLSLIIGKNNSGKTSLLSILERFLVSDGNNFAYEDLNLLAQSQLEKDYLDNNLPEDYSIGISMRLYIQYDAKDNLANVSKFMLNLNPDENVVVISFSYKMKYEDMIKLRTDFASFQEASDHNKKKSLAYFIQKYHSNYFRTYREALEYNNETSSLEIKDRREIDNVINFRRITAKRAVNNSDGSQNRTDNTLSRLSSAFYDKESDLPEANKSVDELRETLSLADEKFTEVYSKVFKNVIDSVKKFGGIKSDDSIIEIISSLKEERVLRDNTSVVYRQDSKSLPEDYNGLGYMNLIAMIFEIEVILNEFKKKYTEKQTPADINLFFIEEPEAHTHPQMQYVFINNIKQLLKEAKLGAADGIPVNLQTLISTHSSHITSESNFDDIKYFYRRDDSSVISKNLSDLKEEYKEDKKQYEFLKQYLTLTRAELFFADKAVLIEGDTERILIPTMMKKLDLENDKDGLTALLTQNISIVEVGAYSHIFEKFIDFLGIKSLIITDIDSVDANGEAIRVANGLSTSNSALNFFFPEKDFDQLNSDGIEQKTLTKTSGKWVVAADGQLCLVYQTVESSYTARSFEDAFIQLNRKFVDDNKDNFRGLKNKKNFDEASNDSYHLAQECILKKTHFALDIIYFSDETYSNWSIPSYISEGLLWLKK
jgi:putative ATP-dependent endonuclease of the OLD family